MCLHVSLFDVLQLRDAPSLTHERTGGGSNGMSEPSVAVSMTLVLNLCGYTFENRHWIYF